MIWHLKTPDFLKEQRWEESTSESVPSRGRFPAVEAFGATDKGRARKTNEDAFLVRVLSPESEPRRAQAERHSQDDPNWPSNCLLAIADGVAGSAGGDRASTLAIAALDGSALVSPMGNSEPDDVVLHEIEEGFRAAEKAIIDDARRHAELHGMGTTLTAAVQRGDRLFVGHAGDSRCYLLRDHKLTRITHDHTVAEEMAEAGIIPPEATLSHPLHTLLTNSVCDGREGSVAVETHTLSLKPGDTVVLCTDGLTDMLPEPVIADLLESESSPQCACALLVDQANEKGGSDNITVVVAHVAES